MIHKKVIKTDKVAIILPTYSPGIGVKGGTLVFISGCLATDNEGKVVGKGDIEAQTKQACENIKAVLEACGGTMDNVVKFTNYFINRDDIPASAKVRCQYCKKPYPPSTSVVVKELVHKDWLVEIEAVAVLDK